MTEQVVTQPGVSIIIPAFDDRLALRQLLVELHKVLPQPGPVANSAGTDPSHTEPNHTEPSHTEPSHRRPLAWELIVVEGWSATVAKSDPRTEDLALVNQWLHSEANRARQLQTGAQAARFSHLWFLHADTSSIGAAYDWLEHRICCELEAGERRFWGRFDVRLGSQRLALRLVAKLMNLRSRWSGICTGDQGLFITGSLLAEVGGWPDQPLMEDVELSSRLKAIMRPLAPRVALVTSARRWQTHGVFRTIRLMWRLRWQYFFGVSPEELHALYNSPGARAAGSRSSGASQ